MPEKAMSLDWMNGAAGRTDTVPPPWTPVCVGKDEFSCWGRTHAFDGRPFPAKISSQGQGLLARPMRLSIGHNGRNAVWKDCCRAAVVRHVNGRWACRDTAGRMGKFALQSSITLHYDGAMRVDICVAPLESAPLESLTLDIPLKREHARFVFAPFANVTRSDDVPPAGAFGSWTSLVWMGSEERGLGWGSDSSQGWDDGHGAIGLIPGKNGIVLRLGFVRQARCLDHPLHFSFGLQANPWRPAPHDLDEYRNMHVNWCYDMSDQDLRDLHGRGVRTLIFHSAWSDMHAYPETRYEKELHGLVRRCHRVGLKLLLYFECSISSGSREWPVWGEHWRRTGERRQEHGYVPYRPPYDPAFVACSASNWRDFIAAGIEHVMKKYGVDGVYLDGLPGWDAGCRNPLHGCGFMRPDGRRAQTNRLWQNRELMERIYVAVRSVKPDGRISLHANPGPLCFSGPFGTDCFGGEQYGGDFRKAGLEQVRALHIGLPTWGMPSELISYTNLEFAVAVGLLHGVLPRPWHGPLELALITGLWGIQDVFGTQRADWHPYFRNHDVISGLPDAVKVSFWNRPGKGMLLVATNMGNDDLEAPFTFAGARLGYSGVAMGGLDMLPCEGALKLCGRRVTALIPAAACRLIFLAPAESRLWPRMRGAAKKVCLDKDLKVRIDEWQMCGPFAPAVANDVTGVKPGSDVPAEYRGMETEFAPETEAGADTAVWRKVKARDHVAITRPDVASEHWSVVYARTRLLFPHLVPLTENNPVDMILTPFNAVWVRLNGKEIFRHGGKDAPRYGQGAPPPVRVRGNLHPGWNDLLIKMVTRAGTGFKFKVTEPGADVPHHLVSIQATDPH